MHDASQRGKSAEQLKSFSMKRVVYISRRKGRKVPNNRILYCLQMMNVVGHVQPVAHLHCLKLQLYKTVLKPSVLVQVAFLELLDHHRPFHIIRLQACWGQSTHKGASLLCVVSDQKPVGGDRVEAPGWGSVRTHSCTCRVLQNLGPELSLDRCYIKTALELLSWLNVDPLLLAPTEWHFIWHDVKPNANLWPKQKPA